MLAKIKSNNKRLGRGYGSGKGGHTSSRGQKGQKSRGKVGVLFEGLKMKKSFYKRLPFMRGKGRLNPSNKPIVINLSDLETLPKTTKVVNVKTLTDSGILNEKDTVYGVKVLGGGDIKDKLKFEVPVSESAASKIKKAGGEVVSG